MKILNSALRKNTHTLECLAAITKGTKQQLQFNQAGIQMLLTSLCQKQADQPAGLDKNQGHIKVKLQHHFFLHELFYGMQQHETSLTHSLCQDNRKTIFHKCLCHRLATKIPQDSVTVTSLTNEKEFMKQEKKERLKTKSKTIYHHAERQKAKS